MSPHHWLEVIAVLLLKPRTVIELVEYTGAHEQTIVRCLRELHKSGFVHRSGSVDLPDDGAPRCVGAKPILWALQHIPFEKEDVVNHRGASL